MRRLITSPRTRTISFLAALVAVFAIAAPAGADRNLSVIVKGTGGAQTTQSVTVKDNAPIDTASIAAMLGISADDVVSITDVTPTDPSTDTSSSSTQTTTQTTTTQPQKPGPIRHPGSKRPRTSGEKPSKAPQSTIAGPALFGLPGLTPLGTPGELIANFRIPPFLLPIYQAAGIEYGIPWQVLAAINSVETDYGRNLSVSSAGALGWMQFMPGTWTTYGVDANGDGKADPYNPADAIFAAAKYLKAAGGSTDLHAAVFSYNHAEWYVNDVLKRARMLAGLPDDLVSSLTGLAQAGYPVANASRIEPNKAAAGEAPSVAISTKIDAPVVAVADGEIVAVGYDPKVGNFVTMRDSYGNRYSYQGLGRVARRYVTRKPKAISTKRLRRELNLKIHDETGKRSPVAQLASTTTGTVLVPDSGGRRRLFANPARPAALDAGGARQLKEAAGPADLHDWFTVPVNISRAEAIVKPLTVGATVIEGTILGHVNSPVGAPRGTVNFSIRPAGKDAPVIDPRPILSGWKLLARTARGAGTGSTSKLKGLASTQAAAAPTIGQVMLMDKTDLSRRVLADTRISMYACGRSDVEAGIIDSRVLATLVYLADRGMNPTVSCLKCGHNYLTKSGNVSEHSSGSAVDIAAINGIPILGNQGVGSITDRAVRALLSLQGTMKPHQIITLMQYPGTDNTLALADHDDHIHVGFHPTGAAAAAAAASIAPSGAEATSKEWSNLVGRLRELPNPRVTAAASRFATNGKRR